MATNSSESALQQTAIGLLARREHSCWELRQKLRLRGYTAAAIDAELARLQQLALLSDERFAQVYAHSRADKGYGPLRIAGELRERGISEALINAVLAELEDTWSERLRTLSARRFAQDGRDRTARERQLRFLRQRGFTVDAIRRLWRDDSPET